MDGDVAEADQAGTTVSDFYFLKKRYFLSLLDCSFVQNELIVVCTYPGTIRHIVAAVFHTSRHHFRRMLMHIRSEAYDRDGFFYHFSRKL